MAEDSASSNDVDNSKTVFYVNEYSKEFQIEPYLNDDDTRVLQSLLTQLNS